MLDKLSILQQIVKDKCTLITLNKTNFDLVKEDFEENIFKGSAKVEWQNPHRVNQEYGYDYFVLVKNNHTYIYRTKLID